MAIKYIRAANIKNKTILVRASVDVPLDGETGEVADDFRIKASLPTLQLLIESDNRVIVCGKRGRPEGAVVKKLSLGPVAERMATLLGLKYFQTDFAVPEGSIGGLVFYTGNLEETKHRERVQAISTSSVVFLENLEFYPEELSSSAAFAKKLAGLADVYVNDDFSKCHHGTASISVLPAYIPSYVGVQLEQEIKALGQVLDRPKHPFVVMMGGAKISDKIKTLTNLGKKADTLLVGGGLANLFFAARGYEIGKSKAEHESVKLAWQTDKNFKGKIILPVDVVVANSAMDKASIRTCPPHEVKKNELILDAGPKTILAFAHVLKQAKTVVWNGPLGFFEHKPFHHSTMALGRIVGAVGTGRAYAVVGGGETVDAVRQAGQADYVDHLSTGGGAMLEYLAGTKLPGIEALEK